MTSRLSLSQHFAHTLGNLLLLGKIGVFHTRRHASSRLLLLISKHLILCVYLVFPILARSRRLNASNLFVSLILHLGNLFLIVFFSSRRRHTRFDCDWSSDVCSSD